MRSGKRKEYGGGEGPDIATEVSQGNGGGKKPARLTGPDTRPPKGAAMQSPDPNVRLKLGILTNPEQEQVHTALRVQRTTEPGTGLSKVNVIMSVDPTTQPSNLTPPIAGFSGKVFITVKVSPDGSMANEYSIHFGSPAPFSYELYLQEPLVKKQNVLAALNRVHDLICGAGDMIDQHTRLNLLRHMSYAVNEAMELLTILHQTMAQYGGDLRDINELHRFTVASLLVPWREHFRVHMGILESQSCLDLLARQDMKHTNEAGSGHKQPLQGGHVTPGVASAEPVTTGKGAKLPFRSAGKDEQDPRTTDRESVPSQHT